jgi:hypothetical protein
LLQLRKKQYHTLYFCAKIKHYFIRVHMINVTTPQKDIILAYFKDDLALVTRYCKMISGDVDKDFKYFVFKDFIFSAAGMMRDIDYDLYNDKLQKPFKVIQHLDQSHMNFQAKSKHVLTVYVKEFLEWQEDYVAQKKRFEDLQIELEGLISNESSLSKKVKLANEHLEKIKAKNPKAIIPEATLDKVKLFRSQHVDTIHLLGERRKELETLQKLLANFEEEHKSLFKEYFKAIKENIEAQYHKALAYFGYKFNKKLFLDAGRSAEVQRFKQKAHIFGDLDLCKYVEYYLKNINSEDLSDPLKKEKLNGAKQYCKNKRERENLF